MAGKKNKVGRGKATKNQPIVVNKSLRGSNKALLNKVQKETLVDLIINLLLESTSKPDIKDKVLAASPVPICDNKATELIRFAVARLEEITKQDAPIVVGTHVANYESIFAYFSKIGNASGCNKAMGAKEKLLGITKPAPVTINQKKTTVIEREVVYDNGKLTSNESDRFQQLIKKATGK